MAGSSGRSLFLCPATTAGGWSPATRSRAPQPFAQAAVAALEDVLVHAVAGDVTGHDQADEGHVQHRGLVGAGVPALDGHDRVDLQPQSLTGYRLGGPRGLPGLAPAGPLTPP